MQKRRRQTRKRRNKRKRTQKVRKQGGGGIADTLISIPVLGTFFKME